jgi:hypothetical protein
MFIKIWGKLNVKNQREFFRTPYKHRLNIILYLIYDIKKLQDLQINFVNCQNIQ